MAPSFGAKPLGLHGGDGTTGHPAATRSHHPWTCGNLTTVDMQRLQELGYGADRDYRVGSPHLSHWQLYDRLTDVLRAAVSEVVEAGLPPNILEVGAGHGGYTEAALAAGASVTATEISRPSAAKLEERYRTNPRLRSVFDPGGRLDVVGDQRFSLVVCSSVLHHIPDYLAFLAGPMLSHLEPGGTFLSFQDPLWFPSVGSFTHSLDRCAQILWRIRQGNLRDGISTFVRRQRGIYDEQNPNDMIEYHVVRQGCDQDAIQKLLVPHFETVELTSYWSTSSALLQRLGEKMNRPNTFMIEARGRS